MFRTPRPLVIVSVLCLFWATILLAVSLRTGVATPGYRRFMPHPVRLGVAYQGLVVIRQVIPGSAAEQAGLQPGDVVLRVNGESVTDAQNFSDRIVNAPSGPVEIEILRDGEPMLLTTELPSSPLAWHWQF